MLLTTSLWLSAFALAGPHNETEKPETPQAEEVREEEVREERKICRRVSDGMGSRRQVRVCMTKQEWREFNRGN